MIDMERKIGEIFEYNGEWYQCIKGLGCNECDLSKITCYHRFESGSCSPNMRKDGTQVIFKKLEKVGEPYEHYGKLYQCYKLPVEIEIRLLPDNCYPVGKDNLVEIEIKQTKEDMEENKLNLKPFDIQKAREGKPVCTKDGRKARIICFDRNDLYPIVALIECKDGKEIVGAYSNEGKTEIYEIKGTDLMMLPEKKEGWVNVYNNPTTHNIYTSADVFESKEIAEEQGTQRNRIATCKITWEE